MKTRITAVPTVLKVLSSVVIQFSVFLKRWFAINEPIVQTALTNNFVMASITTNRSKLRKLIKTKNFFKYFNSSDGYGEVLEKSFGIWHTKCFPKTTAPTRDELEMLCKKLGVTDVTKADARVKNPKPRTPTKSKSDEIPIEFTMFNATKVVPYSKFSPVKVNEGFEIHLKPNKPLAKLVLWDKSDHENCHQMELKCFSEN